MKHSVTFSLIITTFAIWSCNNETNQTAEEAAKIDTTKPAEMKIMIPESICYTSIMGKDTMNLKVEKFPNVVTGNLSYNFYEKDDNLGTIDGTLNGDTLIANYTFMSEGKSSERQVAFLVSDSTAIEGFGPIEEKDGKMIFKSRNTISFKAGTKFIKTTCPTQ